MKKWIIGKSELERLEKLLKIMEENPKSALTEGWRRCANIMDEVEFLYSSCSSGKDSTMTSQMLLMELQRRKWILHMMESDNADDLMIAEDMFQRFNAVRAAGLSGSRQDTIENFRKWDGLRICILQMAYELEYDQSGQLMHRFYKEWATDIRNILPDNIRSKYLINPMFKDKKFNEDTRLGYDLKVTGRYMDDCWNDPIWDSNESVGELGFDLRWVNQDDQKYNPQELSMEMIRKMTPDELREVYGKALVWAWMINSPLAWENNQGVSDSRYISYDPKAEKLWVTPLPDKWDPHQEWSVSIGNMYDPWHGLAPNLVCTPGMTDQSYRVEFSKFITDTVQPALMMGWPEKYYDVDTGEYK